MTSLPDTYTRSRPAGLFPGVVGAPEPDVNRLARYWRPLVDLRQTSVTPRRLRLTAPVAAALRSRSADGGVLLLSRIGVAGLRSQVLRHAGLDHLDAQRPGDLDAVHRSPAWQSLMDVLDDWDSLPAPVRALAVFHLTQLSFCRHAVRLVGSLVLDGTPGNELLAYHAARALSRLPGRFGASLAVFDRLAVGAGDPLLRLQCEYQRIGHRLRVGGAAAAAAVPVAGAAGTPGSWEMALALARRERVLGLVAGARGEVDAASRFLDDASGLLCRGRDLSPGGASADVSADVSANVFADVFEEEERCLADAHLECAVLAGAPGRLRAVVAEYEATVLAADPFCLDARVSLAGGYAALGELDAAATWYAAAGDLGTSAGARAWYLAGRCHDRAGDRERARDAMARCLALDAAAVEPRHYLEGSP